MFCASLGLVEKRPENPTFHHHNQTSESNIDLFAISPEPDASDVSQHCTLENPLNFSSHDPIQILIRFKVDHMRDKNRFSHTYSSFDRKKVYWDPTKISLYQQLAASALSKAVRYWDQPETIPFLSSLVSKLLVQCATTVLPTTTAI